MIKNWKEVEECLTLLATLESEVERQQSILNKKIAELTQKTEVDTAGIREKISAVREELQGFALLHEKEFSNVKTKAFAMGKIGFRTSPPKVAVLNRKFTFKIALEHVKKFYSKYIRIKEELDKDEILSDYAAKAITDEQLARVGLRVDQEENFFCEVTKKELKEA